MTRALVVYESMYGNTHRVAEAIGRGLADQAEVTVVPVSKATPQLVYDADLLVVGGPTHAHSMSRPTTRKSAVDGAAKKPESLTLDADCAGQGVREWLASMDRTTVHAAAFDTRFAGPSLVMGQASRGIAKVLRGRGCHLIAKRQSFFVEKGNRLVADEDIRAETWGRELVKT
ncbi:MAG: flavodoxin family protein [Actinomycetes bacterium]